tara:strand:+ start:118 stop:777 length:660 start_codon:yes stop_codon:yes gene_type:complete
METNDDQNEVINVSYNFAKSIFNDINSDIYKNLNFTKDSIYSSSKISGSNKLIDVITKVTNNNFNLIITDGTANIGTDSIHMSKIFKNINAVELSKINFIALKNNVKILNNRENMNCFNGDINEVISSLKQDLIYIDAPWGGRNYKNFNKLKLYLGKVEILDFYINNKERAKYFIFKIPFNYDFDYLRKYIIDKVTIFPFKKDSKIKYFLLVIERELIV